MVDRDEGISIRPVKDQHSISPFVLHGSVVEYFCIKFCFIRTGTVEQIGINDKIILRTSTVSSFIKAFTILVDSKVVNNVGWS